MAIIPFFGRNRHETPGPGISKDRPQKKPFFRFMEMYFERFWKMVRLSLLTFIACIPIVTVGPAIAGMTKVLHSYVLDKDTFLWNDFKKGFTADLKKTIPVGLVDIVFVISFLCSLNIYPQLAEQTGSSVFYVLCVIAVGFALTVFMMNFFIFPMIVCTDLNMRQIVKNSFFLTALGLKTNVITLLLVILTAALMAVLTILSSPAVLILVPLMMISFVGSLIMFNSYPQIQKHVIEPYYRERGESNPEYDYLKPLDAEDAVFVDMGEEEVPAEDTPSPKKGKVIS
ncbi:MAG: DUF624 domain-containing protein [Oscillospiraceae bacterium]|nr:DUF624 domain-containing protein [Oscillospiraceae bacterium]